jgi:hypothetical protein
MSLTSKYLKSLNFRKSPLSQLIWHKEHNCLFIYLIGDENTVGLFRIIICSQDAQKLSSNLIEFKNFLRNSFYYQDVPISQKQLDKILAMNKEQLEKYILERNVSQLEILNKYKENLENESEN